MITAQHSFAVESALWNSQDFYELDLRDSLEEPDREGSTVLERALVAVGENDAILNHLRHMVITSLSSYQEIVDLTACRHLKTFAEVMVRQRTAQQQSLYDAIEYLSSGDEDDFPDSLSALRSLWRCAIWNLEQNKPAVFVDYLELAEELLEEACLTAAATLSKDPLAAELRAIAVTVCGARSVAEDFATDLIEDSTPPVAVTNPLPADPAV